MVHATSRVFLSLEAREIVVMRALALMMLLGACAVAHGQTDPRMSTLTGLVYDENGAVIVNAAIRIQGIDKIERVTHTSDSGVFEISLKPGNYSIRVESPGFQSFVVETFRVGSSYKGKQNLDIALEVRPCSEIDCHTIEGEPVKKRPNLILKGSYTE